VDKKDEVVFIDPPVEQKF